MSSAQSKLLRIIDDWGGDLSPDAEDQIGCHGAAFWGVVDALRRNGMVTDGAWGTFNITDAGRTALASVAEGRE